MSQQQPTLSPKIIEYLQLAHFVPLVCNNYNALIYVRHSDNTAVIFHDCFVLEVKKARNAHASVIANIILFNWEPIKRYDGLDFGNLFHFMLLMDMMGVIKIRDLQLQCCDINEIYPNTHLFTNTLNIPNLTNRDVCQLSKLN